MCPVRAFSQLLHFQFSVGPDGSATFGNEKPCNLSKISCWTPSNDKLRHIVGVTLSLILAPAGLGNKLAIIYCRYSAKSFVILSVDGIVLIS